MATVIVAHKPELTVEDTAAVFRRHFAGRYEVQHEPARGSFVVRKSRWASLNVSLVQREDSTSFRFTGRIPLLFYVLVGLVFWIGLIGLIGGVIGWIYLRQNWKVMEDEVTSLLLSASEFREDEVTSLLLSASEFR